MENAYRVQILFMIDLIAKTKGEELRAKRLEMLDRLLDRAEADGIDMARTLSMAV